MTYLQLQRSPRRAACFERPAGTIMRLACGGIFIGRYAVAGSPDSIRKLGVTGRVMASGAIY